MRHLVSIYKKQFYDRWSSEIYLPYRKLNDAWNNLKLKQKFDIASMYLYAQRFYLPVFFVQPKKYDY